MNGEVKHKPAGTTEILLSMILEGEGPTVTVEEILLGLKDRAFGIIILFFALPNCILGLPGIGSILGLPIVLLSAQIVLGKHRPWLPQRIKQLKLPRADLKRLIIRASPYILKFEKVCKPRIAFITEGAFLKATGLLILILSSIITLPLPGTNMLPGIAIAAISIGLIERDGLIVLLSTVLGFVFMYISGFFAYEGFRFILKFLGLM